MTRRTRLSAYAFCVDDGALLLVRISEHGDGTGKWTLPGGGLDWGEDPEDGMHRELHEETGLTGEIQGILGVDSLVYPRDRPVDDDSLHAVRIVYRVECRGTPGVVEVDGTVDAARWVPLEHLGEYPLVGLVRFAVTAAGLGEHLTG